MACLTLKTTLTPQAAVSVATTPSAKLGMVVDSPAVVKTQVSTPAALDMEQVPKAALEITPTGGAQLALGEVCTINGGSIVVLAGSDGPFRTRDGGYFLLDPAKNPPED